jgi:hypothetical protein
MDKESHPCLAWIGTTSLNKELIKRIKRIKLNSECVRMVNKSEVVASFLVKLSLQQTLEAHRIVRRQGSHIFALTNDGELIFTRRPPFNHRKIPGTHFQ